MAQITGRRRPNVFLVGNPSGDEYRPASVIPYDSLNNGALAVADMPLPLTQRVDSIDPLITYVGYSAPETADPDSPAWLVRRITDDGSGLLIVEHAVVPAAGGKAARFATAEHIWTDRASLVYA